MRGGPRLPLTFIYTPVVLAKERPQLWYAAVVVHISVILKFCFKGVHHPPECVSMRGILCGVMTLTLHACSRTDIMPLTVKGMA